jgi:hypothetical protein
MSILSHLVLLPIAIAIAASMVELSPGIAL